MGAFCTAQRAVYNQEKPLVSSRFVIRTFRPTFETNSSDARETNLITGRSWSIHVGRDVVSSPTRKQSRFVC